MWFVKNPEWFDVIVTDNMFGDIITDLGAMIQGGMGIAAGGNINPNGASMFEPIGGSAPKYTGQGVINPLAAICAGQMLLDFLGEEKAARSHRKHRDQSHARKDQEPGGWQDGLYHVASRRSRSGGVVAAAFRSAREITSERLLHRIKSNLSEIDLVWGKPAHNFHLGSHQRRFSGNRTAKEKQIQHRISYFAVEILIWVGCQVRS
jgi:hypothetical protein